MTVIDTTIVDEATGEVLPAIPDSPAMLDIAQHQMPAVVSEAAALWQIAERVARTEMVPKDLRGRPEAVFAVVMYGRELGFGPMQSLQSIHFIEGKPTQSADLMRATVLRHGHTFRVVKWDREECVLFGQRRDEDEGMTIGYTTEDAKDAGLLSKKVWREYRMDMLFARATSRLCKAMFSDCLSGVIYTAEELEPIEVEGREVAQPTSAELSPADVRMGDANRNRFLAMAKGKGLDDEAIGDVIATATAGRTRLPEELRPTDVAPLRDALAAWEPPPAPPEVPQEAPAAEEAAPVNQFEVRGRETKAHKLAGWLIAEGVALADVEAAGPVEQAAVAEQAGVKAPSPQTWAQVVTMVRMYGEAHRPADQQDPFDGITS